MTDADHLRAQIENALDLGEKVQFAALAYQDAIAQLRSATLLLDLNSDSVFSRTIRNLVGSIGKEISIDQELTAQVQTELTVWKHHV